ncbi:MAG: LLM class flavin-dependent oxidoreductase [Dehalococcoidia bacterium]
MQAKCNVFASVLAGVTKRVKIVLLGNPLPLADDPIRLAEELSMIDMISKGRLVSGFVRGGGQEQLAANVNPAYNRERFEEAHDLIVKAWTQPGPFRWEGTHYQMRVVNPWAVPLQKPHPRIWVPGVASKETVIWAAEHRYPYICLNTAIDTTKKIWELYDEAAGNVGYTPGPEHRGYLLRVHVSDSEERALRNAREFMWMRASSPAWPTRYGVPLPGYSSPSNRRTFVEIAAGRRPHLRSTPFEQQIHDMQIIAGTPDQVVAKLRTIMEATRPGIFAYWADGNACSHEDTKLCIRLLGQEVMPAVRDIAQELDLPDPWQANAP